MLSLSSALPSPLCHALDPTRWSAIFARSRERVAVGAVDGDCVPFVPPSSDKSNSEKKLPAAQPLHVVDPGEANRPA